MKLANPVFIVGIPRSGTTLVENILLLHSSFRPRNLISYKGKIPKAPSPMETRIFQYIKQNFNDPLPLITLMKRVYYSKSVCHPAWRYQFVENDRLFENFIKKSCLGFFLNTWIKNHEIRKNCKKWIKYLLIDRLLWKLEGELVFKKFIKKRTEALEQIRPLEKTPTHYLYLREIFWTFPKAKIVSIYRHPVDIYASTKRRLFREKELYSEGYDWLEIDENEFCEIVILFKKAIDDIFNIKQASKIVTIKYEDLCRKPEESLKKILNFLGEPYEVSCIQGDRPIRNESSIFPFKSNVPVANLSLWSDILSRDSVDKIQTKLSDYMKGLGYEHY